MASKISERHAREIEELHARHRREVKSQHDRHEAEAKSAVDHIGDAEGVGVNDHDEDDNRVLTAKQTGAAAFYPSMKS